MHKEIECDEFGKTILVYTFTRSWSDGTRSLKRSPLELLESLAALVVRPQFDVLTYRIRVAMLAVAD